MVNALLTEGFGEEAAMQIAELQSQNPAYSTNWMLNYVKHIPSPEKVKPVYTGLATFLSFIVFGSVPLLPYLFSVGDTLSAFVLSVITVVMALSLLGVLKWKVVGGRAYRSIFEIVTIGGTAAVVAFVIGMLFP
jgi:VIT1/CCC1 family predicted Fe2+/Mn2+ transporter